MPLTSIGLEYANVTSLEELKAATKLNIDVNEFGSLPEIKVLFSKLAECTELKSLQVNFVNVLELPTESSQVYLQTFIYLKQALMQWGGRLRTFELFVETNFKDDDQYELTFLDVFQQLQEASTRLTSLTDCLIHINANGNKLNNQLFNFVVNFLSMLSLSTLKTLKLKLNNCMIISDDFERHEVKQVYSNFMSVLNRCQNLQLLFIQANFLPSKLQDSIVEFIAANRTLTQIGLSVSQTKLDLRKVITLLQNPRLQQVNIDLNSVDNYVSRDLLRRQHSQVELQIIPFAQAIKNHTSLVSFSLSGFFEGWLHKNIDAHRFLIKQMFYFISKSKSLRDLKLNLNLPYYFSAMDGAEITRFFLSNPYLNRMDIRDLQDVYVGRLLEHLQANNAKLKEILLQDRQFTSLNPTQIIQNIWHPLHKKVQQWSFSECVLNDSLLFFYLITLPKLDLIESKFYMEYMSSVFHKIYKKGSGLPHNIIASYLDKQDIAKVLQNTGGFFVQLKKQLHEGGVKRQWEEDAEEEYIVKRR